VEIKHNIVVSWMLHRLYLIVRDQFGGMEVSRAIEFRVPEV